MLLVGLLACGTIAGIPPGVVCFNQVMPTAFPFVRSKPAFSGAKIINKNREQEAGIKPSSANLLAETFRSGPENDEPDLI